MKILALLVALLPLISYAGVPPQSQAAEIAVPMNGPKHHPFPGPFKYAGAVLVVQCKLVYGLVFIGKDGKAMPMHLVRDMSQQKLLELVRQADPDNVWQVETPCGSDQST